MNSAQENQFESWNAEMEEKKRRFGNVLASIRKSENEPFKIQMLKVDPFSEKIVNQFGICDMKNMIQAATWVEATYRNFFTSQEVEIEHDYL